MPPGAFSSIVSNGPMNDQRKPSPSLSVLSRSGGVTYPSPARRNASDSSAACRRLRMKPSISRWTTIGTWPTDSWMAFARAIVSGEVHGAPTSSTSGTRWGGLTGWATRQRARPLSVCVNRLATIGAVERVRHAFCRAHPRGGVLDQAMREQFVEAFGHQGASLVGDARRRVVERHVEAGAGEDDGPGAADQARSDGCDALVHSHSSFLLNSRSCFSRVEAPVQVTEPRSSTTVRSDNASASSR